jgi:hypothetical protein
LFARNAMPGPEHRFYYATPLNEPDLNGSGRLRIDYESAHPISVFRVREEPWLLKTLSFGTRLDVEIVESLFQHSHDPLMDYWESWDRECRKTGQGFNRSIDLEQKYVDFLGDLAVFEPPDHGFSIDHSSLETYRQLYGSNSDGLCGAHMPRRKELYQPPLVIIPQAPGEDFHWPKAFISFRPLAFSQSYYGYSCAGHPEAEVLASLLYLLPHTTLFGYFCLMTSRRSGFDRHTFNKEEFDAIPFPDVVELPIRTKSTINELAHRLQFAHPKPWDEINNFIFELYGLNADSVQVARDTLFAAAPYRKAGKAAFDYTDRSTRAPFIATLRDSLEPYFDICGEHADIREVEFRRDRWDEPWVFLMICPESRRMTVNDDLLREAMALANRHGSSRIIVETTGNLGLLLGLLNRQRWWTVTRSRLCAQNIIRDL